MIRWRIDTDRSAGAKAKTVAVLTVDEETLERLAAVVEGAQRLEGLSGDMLYKLDADRVDLRAALLGMART